MDTSEFFSRMKLSELKDYIRVNKLGKQVKGYSSMKKSELIAKLVENTEIVKTVETGKRVVQQSTPKREIPDDPQVIHLTAKVKSLELERNNALELLKELAKKDIKKPRRKRIYEKSSKVQPLENHDSQEKEDSPAEEDDKKDESDSDSDSSL